MKTHLNKKAIAIAAAVVVVVAVATAVAKHQPANAAVTTAAQPASVLTVEVAALQKQSWPERVQANGMLAPWQEVIVSPETSELRLAELLVDVGSTVKRGQVLARLADDTVKAEVQKQQALVAQAEATLDKAVADLKRAQAVDVAGAVSPQQLDQYKTTEASARASLASVRADLATSQLRMTHTRITAPDDGIVSSRSGVLGNVVSTGAEIYRLVRQGRIEWQAELDARQLAHIHAGQTVQVTLPSGSMVDGKVRLVAPTLSSTTGRAIVYVSLPTREGVRSGVFASGAIALGTTDAQTLPQSAIVLRDGRSYVYVLGNGDTVSSRVVTEGRRQGDRVEILTGLEAGTQVVASGGGFLSEGAKVTVKASGASAQ